MEEDLTSASSKGGKNRLGKSPLWFQAHFPKLVRYGKIKEGGGNSSARVETEDEKRGTDYDGVPLKKGGRPIS